MKADYVERIVDNFKRDISVENAYHRSEGYVFGLLDAEAIDVFDATKLRNLINFLKEVMKEDNKKLRAKEGDGLNDDKKD